jgi:hypothetical protein
MCDPVSMAVGAVGDLFGSKQRSAAAPADPAAERAAAEAEATTAANRKLAAAQARRREQSSLMARGAPQPTLGDVPSAEDGLLDSRLVSRSNNAVTTLLSSRIAKPAGASVVGPSGNATQRAIGSRLSRNQAY